MLKKWVNKQTICTFIISGLLFSTISVGAKIMSYTLIQTKYKTQIAGQDYTDNKTPILTYNKIIYIPLTNTIVNDLNLDIDLYGNNLTIQQKKLRVNFESVSNDNIVYDGNNDKFVCLDSNKDFKIDQVEYDTFILTYLPENKQAPFCFNNSEVIQLHDKYYFKLDKVNNF